MVEYFEPIESSDLPKSEKLKHFKCMSKLCHDTEIIFGSQSEHNLGKNAVFNWPSLLYRVLGGTVFKVLWRHPKQKTDSLLGCATVPPKAPKSSDEDLSPTSDRRVHTRLHLPVVTNVGVTAAHVNIYIEIGRDMNMFGQALLDGKDSYLQCQDSSDYFDIIRTRTRPEVNERSNVHAARPVLRSPDSKVHTGRKSCRARVGCVSRKRSVSSGTTGKNHLIKEGHNFLEISSENKNARSLTGHTERKRCKSADRNLGVHNHKENHHSAANEVIKNNKDRNVKNLYPTVIQVPLVPGHNKAQETQRKQAEFVQDKQSNPIESRRNLKVSEEQKQNQERPSKLEIFQDTKSRRQKFTLCHLCRAREAENFPESPEYLRNLEVSPKEKDCLSCGSHSKEATNVQTYPVFKESSRPGVQSGNGLGSSRNRHCCCHQDHLCCCTDKNTSKKKAVVEAMSESNWRFEDVGKQNYENASEGRRCSPMDEQYNNDYNCYSGPTEYDYLARVTKSRLGGDRNRYDGGKGDNEIWTNCEGEAEPRRVRTEEADFVEGMGSRHFSRDHEGDRMVCHELTLSVDRVTGFPMFSSEFGSGLDLDCFVSYSFPTVNRGITGINRWTTEVTSGSPDANFNSVFCHSLRIELTKSLAMVLNSSTLAANTASYSVTPGVTLKLWARKYDPQPKDYIIATALLPYSKLFAMEMKFDRQKERKLTVKEIFRLPLKLMPCSLTSELAKRDIHHGGGFGSVHITVSYKNYFECTMSALSPNDILERDDSKFRQHVKGIPDTKNDIKKDSGTESFSYKFPKSTYKSSNSSSLSSSSTDPHIERCKRSNFDASRKKNMNDYCPKVAVESTSQGAFYSDRNWKLDEPTKLDKESSSISSVLDDPLPHHLSTIMEGGSGMEDISDMSSESKRQDLERLEMKYDLRDGDNDEDFHLPSRNGSFELRTGITDQKWIQSTGEEKKEDRQFEIRNSPINDAVGELRDRPSGRCTVKPIPSVIGENNEYQSGTFLVTSRGGIMRSEISRKMRDENFKKEENKIVSRDSLNAPDISSCPEVDGGRVSPGVQEQKNKQWDPSGRSNITSVSKKRKNFETFEEVGNELRSRDSPEGIGNKKECESRTANSEKYNDLNPGGDSSSQNSRNKEVHETRGRLMCIGTEAVMSDCDFDDKSTQTSLDFKRKKSIDKRPKTSRGSNTDFVCADQGGESSEGLIEEDKEELFFARVEIERAFNLPLILGDNNVSGDCQESFKRPSTYVSFMGYIDGRPKELKTKIVPKDTNPIWDSTWEIMLPVKLLHKCDCSMKFVVHEVSTHVPRSSSSAWHSGDTFVGSNCGSKCVADVDLTALSAGLPFICGWFYLNNYSRSCGQIKITVTPLEDISKYRSRWLKEYSLKRYQEVDCVRLSGSSRSSEVYLAQGLYSRLPHLLQDSSDLMYSHVSEFDLFKASADDSAASQTIAPTAQASANEGGGRTSPQTPRGANPEEHHQHHQDVGNTMETMTTSLMALSLKEKLSELAAMTEGMKKKLKQDRRQTDTVSKVSQGEKDEETSTAGKGKKETSAPLHQCPFSNKRFEEVIENMGKHPKKKRKKKKKDSAQSSHGRESEEPTEVLSGCGRVFHTELFQRLGFDQRTVILDSLEASSVSCSSASSVANQDERDDHVCPLEDIECCSPQVHQDEDNVISVEALNRVLNILRTASPCQSTSRKEPDGGSRIGHHNQDEDEEKTPDNQNEQQRALSGEMSAEEIERLVQKFKEKLMQAIL